jgi:hypothetical protein
MRNLDTTDSSDVNNSSIRSIFRKLTILANEGVVMPDCIYKNLQLALNIREEDRRKNFYKEIHRGDDVDGHQWVIDQLRNLLVLFRHGPRIQLSIDTETFDWTSKRSSTVWDLYDVREQDEEDQNDNIYHHYHVEYKKDVCFIYPSDETEDREMLDADDIDDDTDTTAGDDAQDDSEQETVGVSVARILDSPSKENKSLKVSMVEKKFRCQKELFVNGIAQQQEVDDIKRTPILQPIRQENRCCITNAQEHRTNIPKCESPSRSNQYQEKENQTSFFCSQSRYAVLSMRDECKVADSVWEMDVWELDVGDIETACRDDDTNQERKPPLANKLDEKVLSEDYQPAADWETLYNELDE